MDAVKFLKAKNRLCREYEDCFVCPIGNDSGGCQAGVSGNQNVTEEMLVQIVEKWAAEHQKKTRQSEFLEMFPNAPLNPMNDMTIGIDPCDVDAKYKPHKGCDKTLCSDCQREYWNEEVER